jgi:hypothetical protein
MTCTEENWPRELGRDLQRWRVEHGTLAGMKQGGPPGFAAVAGPSA